MNYFSYGIQLSYNGQKAMMSTARISKFNNVDTVEEFFNSFQEENCFVASVTVDNYRALILTTEQVKEDLRILLCSTSMKHLRYFHGHLHMQIHSEHFG